MKHGEGYGSTDVPESSGHGAPKTSHTTGIDASESTGYPATLVSGSSGETALPDSRRQAYHASSPCPFPLTWWHSSFLAGLGHKRQAEQGWKARSDGAAADGDTGRGTYHVATNGLHPRAKIRRYLMRSLSTVCLAHTQGKHEPGSTPQFGTSSEHGQQGSSPGGPGVGASFQPSPTPSTPLTDMGHKVGGRLSRDLTGVRPPRAGEGSSEHVLRVEERPGSTAQWTNEGTADGPAVARPPSVLRRMWLGRGHK